MGTNSEGRGEAAKSHDLIRVGALLIFFVSGFPAMLYQLVWQRCLFTMYGINVEAVAVVVTGFMLGLGFGSLCGGHVSRRLPNHLLLVFALTEFAIGLFGYLSLPAFDLVAAHTLALPSVVTSVIALSLLLVPTMLMGATLPLLVTYLVRRAGNVGRSVGLLYFVNTMGSAVACFLAAGVLMGRLGMDGSIGLAVVLNWLVGSAGLIVWFTQRRRDKQIGTLAPETPFAPSVRRHRAALLLSVITGFVALSFEIVWFRVISVASGGLAPAFAVTLGAYLAGIAIGSAIGRRWCRQPSGQGNDHMRALGVVSILAGVLGFALVPVVAETARLGTGPLMLVALLLVALHGAFSGASFPLICHHGIEPDGNSGARISQVYMANIIGSAVGSLATGFVLLDLLTTKTTSVILALTGIALGWMVLARNDCIRRSWAIVLAAGCAAVMIGFVNPLWAGAWEKLILTRGFQDNVRFVDVVENKSGVIAVTQDRMVFGGGMYDGRISTDLVNDLNGLHRPFASPAFHPAAHKVLMIGLATGAWAEILASMPELERLDIIEINRGYMRLIERYGEVRDVLSNPKVHIVVDDGRKWLNKNPEARYDLIIQNTTFNFRSNVTNLLSQEFLQIIRRHLNPGGIFYYNTQGNKRVQMTACMEQPGAFRYSSMMIMPADQVSVDPARWETAMTTWLVGGKIPLDLSQTGARARLDELLATLAPQSSELETCDSILAKTTGVAPITDRNMGEEWARTSGTNDPLFRWLRKLL